MFAPLLLIGAVGWACGQSIEGGGNLPIGTAQSGGSCGEPARYGFQVQQVIPRSVRGLTEGLIIEDGVLYESTGRISGHGAPVFNRIDPVTGEVTRLKTTPFLDFGEGLTKLGDSFYQLTYKEGRVHEYRTNGTPEGTRKVKTHDNPMREGWGLTTDGKDLLATEGSEYLYRIDPESFKVEEKVAVRNASGERIEGLNELEYVGGQIYANIFPTSRMIRFDPISGCQTAEIDLEPLRDALNCPSSRLECNRHSVANGIAYDPVSAQFYVTGKSWPFLMKGHFVHLQ